MILFLTSLPISSDSSLPSKYAIVILLLKCFIFSADIPLAPWRPSFIVGANLVVTFLPPIVLSANLPNLESRAFSAVPATLEAIFSLWFIRNLLALSPTTLSKVLAPLPTIFNPLLAVPNPFSKSSVDAISPKDSIPSVNTTSPKKYLSKTAPELELLKASHLLNLSLYTGLPLASNLTVLSSFLTKSFISKAEAIPPASLEGSLTISKGYCFPDIGSVYNSLLTALFFCEKDCWALFSNSVALVCNALSKLE